MSSPIRIHYMLSRCRDYDHVFNVILGDDRRSLEYVNGNDPP